MESANGFKKFFLNRISDESGMSGVGRVAEGVILPNGTAVLWWLLPPFNVGIYHSVNDLQHTHGHGEKYTTKIIIEKY